MLFGQLNPTRARFRDDVAGSKPPLDCFAFERPLILTTELHVAGAMAFATSFGFAGVSLVEWALMQSLDSATRREARAESDDGPPSRGGPQSAR